MFIVFYTVKICVYLYIYDLFHILLSLWHTDPWNVFVYTCMHLCMYYVCTYIRVCVRIYIHTYICMYVYNVCVCIYMYVLVNLTPCLVYTKGKHQASSQWGAPTRNLQNITEKHADQGAEKICNILLHSCVPSVEPPRLEITHFETYMYMEGVLFNVVVHIIKSWCCGNEKSTWYTYVCMIIYIYIYIYIYTHTHIHSICIIEHYVHI
jgi:hypothetical protein